MATIDPFGTTSGLSKHPILNQLLNNAPRDTGLSLNPALAPNTRPDTDLQHIEYILYAGPIAPRAILHVQSRGGSDHMPVIAEFQFAADAPK